MLRVFEESHLTLDPYLKVELGYDAEKGFISCLLSVFLVCDVETTCSKSWTANHI